jgi:Arc/MetJ-type ribon-helix-helix transcriptional regulator
MLILKLILTNKVVFLKQYVLNAEPALIKEVDGIVKTEKLYNSRNEFMREAVRDKVLEFRKLKLRELVKKARATAVANGWTGKMPTQKQRDKIAREYLAEKGISLE